MSFLSKIMQIDENSAHIFDHKIEQLESRSGNSSMDSHISGKIRENSAKILQELGFCGTEVLAREAFLALKNKLIGGEIVVGNGENEFWDRYRFSAILAEDGIVSANKSDIRAAIDNPLSYENCSNDNFKLELFEEIARKYSGKISDCSKKDIIDKLMGN